MQSRLTVQLAAEDRAQELLLRVLSDTVLEQGLGDPETLRVFIPSEGLSYFPTSGATARLRERMGVRRGRPFYRSRRLFGQPAGEAAEIMDAVDCILLEQHDIGAILLLVDEDGSSKRRRDTTRAAEHYAAQDGPVIVIGLCVPTAEGWLVPLIGQGVPERVAALKKALSFDPVKQPHRLTSQPKTSERLAKRVLHALLDETEKPLKHQPASTPGREETEAALSRLELELAPPYRLDACGLASFIAALQDRYVSAAAQGSQAESAGFPP